MTSRGEGDLLELGDRNLPVEHSRPSCATSRITTLGTFSAPGAGCFDISSDGTGMSLTVTQATAAGSDLPGWHRLAKFGRAAAVFWVSAACVSWNYRKLLLDKGRNFMCCTSLNLNTKRSSLFEGDAADAEFGGTWRHGRRPTHHASSSEKPAPDAGHRYGVRMRLESCDTPGAVGASRTDRRTRRSAPEAGLLRLRQSMGTGTSPPRRRRPMSA